MLIEALCQHLQAFFGDRYDVCSMECFRRVYVDNIYGLEVCTLEVRGDSLILHSDLDDPGEPYGRTDCFLLADPECLSRLETQLLRYRTDLG